MSEKYNLMLVESPSKAKTIEKYLGSKFKVLATFGHVRDIPSKSGSVEPDKDFLMHYQINPYSKKHLDAIIKYIIDHDSNLNIYLSTDPDREGEAISWHVVEALSNNKKIKLDKLTIKRCVFNEITKEAVNRAVKNPRDIDTDLVDSQQARRALDYLVGFTISPLLWKTVGRHGASAGRVQSVALRLITDREREILDFKAEEYWTIDANFLSAKEDFQLNGSLYKYNNKKVEKFSFKAESEALEAVNTVSKMQYSLKNIERKQQQRSPQPPFTTSSLQQDGSRKLGFNPKRTMSIAQKLYEGVKLGGEVTGLITYMRTDGVYVSDAAVLSARDLIKKKFGASFCPSSSREYKNKSKNAQEAHEAIRPTDMHLTPDDARPYLSDEESKLYELIWKRMIASQMSNSVHDIANVFLSSNDDAHEFKSSFSKLKFAGYTLVYSDFDTSDSDDKSENGQTMIGDLDKLDSYKGSFNILDVLKKQHFTSPPPRYGEAGLIKKMEEIGIGRPSTYATIISVLQDREYVHLNQKRFFATVRGHVITNFLTSYFGHYFAYGFTAGMEENLDEIADGHIAWKDVLRNFWTQFNGSVDEVSKIEIPNIINSVSHGMRPYLFQHNDLYVPAAHKEDADQTIIEASNDNAFIDDCPLCKEISGGKLGLKFSKFGYFLGCNKYPECSYTKPINELLSLGVDNNSSSAVSTGDASGTMFSDSLVPIYKDDSKQVTVYLKKGKYGNYLEIHDAQSSAEGSKPRNMGIPQILIKGLNDNLIKNLINLPLKIGYDNEGNEVALNLGAYGFYVKRGTDLASVKMSNPFEISLDEAIDFLDKNAEKIKRNSKSVELTGIGEMILRKGGFGKVYLQFAVSEIPVEGKESIKIPVGTKLMMPKGSNFNEPDMSIVAEIAHKAIKKFIPKKKRIAKSSIEKNVDETKVKKVVRKKKV